MKVSDLDAESRLRLVRFVCSFAWADLEVQDAERTFVQKLLGELGLDEEERKAADEWLRIPPMPEEVDPTDIPEEHRQIFLNTALQVVGADGNVDPAEMETLALFEKLLRAGPDDSFG
jgi:uncharacterized tellurite resistance protein B-like protein